jgi:hypothetical protein
MSDVLGETIRPEKGLYSLLPYFLPDQQHPTEMHVKAFTLYTRLHGAVETVIAAALPGIMEYHDWQ